MSHKRSRPLIGSLQGEAISGLRGWDVLDGRATGHIATERNVEAAGAVGWNPRPHFLLLRLGRRGLGSRVDWWCWRGVERGCRGGRGGRGVGRRWLR